MRQGYVSIERGTIARVRERGRGGAIKCKELPQSHRSRSARLNAPAVPVSAPMESGRKGGHPRGMAGMGPTCQADVTAAGFLTKYN
jgi:hypothetical protein